MTVKRIGIVGAGMAGIQALGAYLKNDNLSCEIHIFDSKKHSGYGLPFIPDDKSLLLNQPQDQMSLTEEPNHYKEWIEKHHPKEAKNRFTTRWRFGEYSRQLFDIYLEDKRVHHHTLMINNLKITDEYFTLVDENNKTHTFDVVHLCFGQMPYSDPYDLKNEKGYYGNPYPLSRIKNKLLKSKNIGIVGCGLSAVDFFIFLQTKNYKGHIFFLCHGQRFPLIRAKDIDALALPHLDKVMRRKHIRLADILTAFKADAQHFEIDLEHYIPKINGHPLSELLFQEKHLEKLGILQHMVLKYHDDYPTVWNQFTLEEQNTFAEDYLDIFQLIKSPMPLRSARKIIKGIETSSTHIVAFINRIEKKRKYFHVETTTDTLKIETILNGTGPVFQPKDAGHDAPILPLVESMLNERILQQYNDSCFEVTFPDFSVVSQRYGILQNLKLHGQTVAGINLANNDIGVIGNGVRSAVADVISRF
ncbi:FAD-NAD(P)-binding protein [Balneicella halophila]|uniref:FAD-NAD(P)-binding protein n=1 Tax=Balneicella halophila TaxID=1537566 RepID=A0A7L4UNC5_BALHA|nr:FAD/NAD(P)-binding protein [Balneicella halophila]PVX49397.1 FAD-NAD(P)-binding protein [Balneicella halophila]